MFQKDVFLPANQWVDLRVLANALGAGWTDSTPFVAQNKVQAVVTTISDSTQPADTARDGAIVEYADFATFQADSGKAWAFCSSSNGRMFLQEAMTGV